MIVFFLRQKTSASTSPSMSYRQDFDSIRSIPDHYFQQQLLDVVDKEHRFKLSDCKMVRRIEGSYNHVAILTLDSLRYAVKVPAQGTPELWSNADALEMRSEAYTMMFLRRHTSIPILQVFGWDASCDNSLGAPYIVQAGGMGVPAHECFFEYGDDGNLDICKNESPSPALQKRRHRMLRELAGYMAELQQFKFDQSGILYFEDNPEWEDAEPPTVGPSFKLLFSVEEQAAFSNTEELLYEKKDEWVEAQKAYIEGDYEFEESEKLTSLAHIRGASVLLDCAITEFPGTINPDNEDELFVLTHPDADLQNILVDPRTGRIVSIIDWQGIRTVPRAMGGASLPLFLHSDWEPNYKINQNLSPWTLDMYRELYAGYMEAALGPGSDAVYMRHSYWAWYTFHSICEGQKSDIGDWIDRILIEIPFLSRFHGDEFLVRLGTQRWPVAEYMLCKELQRLYNPSK